LPTGKRVDEVAADPKMLIVNPVVEDLFVCHMEPEVSVLGPNNLIQRGASSGMLEGFNLQVLLPVCLKASTSRRFFRYA